MPSVFPDVNIYIDLNNDGIPETDISSRVVSNISGEHGIFNFNDTDRLPSIGTMSFDLNNSDGAYATGTYIGKIVRVSLTYSGREKNAFFGSITKFSLDSGEWGDMRAHVTVSDWFNVANNTRANELQLATLQTSDEALGTLLDTLPNPPAYRDFDAGTEVFPNMFDGGRDSTKVYSELDKISKSELGYIYMKFRDNLDGDTIRLENSLARGSTRPLDTIPVVADAGFLKWRNGVGNGYLLWRNGADSGKIKISEREDGLFNAQHLDANWSVGENVVNDFSVTIIPRDTDATPVVLYTLDAPIPIGTMEKVTIGGRFVDPDGGRIIQAFDVVSPVATTDYLFNANAGGTGTNLTGNLQTLLNYSATQFIFTVRNTGVPGYLTFLQVRGKGIYKYNPIDYSVENVESQEDFVGTEISASMTREYSGDLNTSKNFADGVIAVNRHPNRLLKSITFDGNTSDKLLLAFMYLEQGSKVEIVETFPSHTGRYYIQGVKFNIELGGGLTYTWYLKEAVETLCQPIEVHSPTDNVGGRTVALDYKILPQLANLQNFSYSFWIKRTSSESGPFGPVIGRSVDDGSGRRGHFLIISGEKFLFTSYKTPTDGSWETGNVIPSVNVWEHVVLTYDNSTATADPAVWFNGVSKTVTETATPAGTTDDDADCPMVLFNIMSNLTSDGGYYYDVVKHFALKDVRVYNRILTAEEIADLASHEDDYSTVQEGLVFQGIYAPRSNIGDYANTTILEDDLVLETVYGEAGIPFNSDTSSDDLILHGKAV